MTRDAGHATAAYFDRLAAAAEAPFAGNVNKWQAVEPLLDDVPAGAAVLECGAGTGLYTVQMLRRGYRVVAVDVSGEALAVNRRTAARAGLAADLETVRGRFQNVARALGRSFDAVTYFKTLHHFPDLASIGEAIETGYDVVGPGGVLVGLEPNGECPFWRPGLLVRGRHSRGGQSVWAMERNLLLITERNLARAFRRLGGASWRIGAEYVIPAVVANRLPGVCGPLNRLLARTPLRRRAFNLTFRVRKGP